MDFFAAWGLLIVRIVFMIPFLCFMKFFIEKLGRPGSFILIIVAGFTLMKITGTSDMSILFAVLAWWTIVACATA